MFCHVSLTFTGEEAESITPVTGCVVTLCVGTLTTGAGTEVVVTLCETVDDPTVEDCCDKAGDGC
jgi:hypothetical protein